MGKKFTPEEAVQFIVKNYAGKIEFGEKIGGGFTNEVFPVRVYAGANDPQRDLVVQAFKALEGKQPGLVIASQGHDLREELNFQVSPLGTLALKEGLRIAELEAASIGLKAERSEVMPVH